MSHRLTRLTDQHTFDFFDCGESSLDEWAQKHALGDQSIGKSATHVWTDTGGSYVVAYFTLLPTVTRADDGLFSKIKPKRFQGQEVPGILVGKLALDTSLRGGDSGIELLADAIIVASDAMDLVGGVHIVVDPMADRPKLRGWYIDAGFKAIEGTGRLYLNIRG